MKLSYEYVSHLLLISALSKFSFNSKRILSSFAVPEMEIELDFKEYVLSQIQVPVVKVLFNRNLNDFFYVYKTDFSESEALDKLYAQFLKDVRDFLVNNPNNIKLKVTKFGETVVDYSTLNYNFTQNEYRNDEMRRISKYVTNGIDLQNKVDSYRVIYALEEEVSALG